MSYANILWLEKAELKSGEVFNCQVYKQEKIESHTCLQEKCKSQIKSWYIKEKCF